MLRDILFLFAVSCASIWEPRSLPPLLLLMKRCTGACFFFLLLIPFIFFALSVLCRQPERDLMKRPPRDRRKDRMVTWTMLAYTLFVGGLVETVFSYISFFVAMHSRGIPPSYFIGTNQYWTATSDDLVIDGRVSSSAFFSSFLLSSFGYSAHLTLCSSSSFPSSLLPIRGLFPSFSFVALPLLS